MSVLTHAKLGGQPKIGELSPLGDHLVIAAEGGGGAHRKLWGNILWNYSLPRTIEARQIMTTINLMFYAWK